MRPFELLALTLAVVFSTAAFACGGDSSSDQPVRHPFGKLPGGLEPCSDEVLSEFRCGKIRVPLERTDPELGKIGIGFAVRPPSDRSRARVGTIFAVEGGPGYASTATAKDYVALFGDLLERRRLVLVDMRGTGMSGALRCRGSQRAKAPDQVLLARCARKLGPRFDSYRTGAAADDIDDVRRALGVRHISLYGDSYGTYLAESYAFRHGKTLRALVLDSAYPLTGESPWYPSGPRTGIRSLQLACSRAPQCEGNTRARLRRATARLRGSERNVVYLLDAIWNAGYSPPGAYLRVDRAVRELLRGDPGLYNSVTGGDDAGYGPVEVYSHALEMVVSCNDYPMLWEKTASEQQRRRQLADEIRDYPKRAFAPFLPSEVTRSIFLNYRYCLTAPPPGPLYELPAPEGSRPTEAPVLVVSGEMDDVTTPTEGRYVAEDFPNSRQYIARNAGHVDPLYYPERPAAREIRAFLRRHG